MSHTFGNPDESPDSRRMPQFDALGRQLDDITRRERALADAMRALASQSDDLMDEVAHLRAMLTNLPADAIRFSSDAKRNTESPSSEISSAPPPLTETSPASSSSSFLSRELAERGAGMFPTEEQFGPQSREIAPQEQSSMPADTPELASVTPEVHRGGLPYPEAPARDYGSFELNLGIKWLSRIGIVALLIGIAMALSYSFPHFSKEMKLLTGFVLAGVLFGVGAKLYDKASVLGRILQGGGISTGYLSLFAVFFIPGVQLLEAPGLGFGLLLAYVAGILVLAHRLNSQTVALLSLAFGFYTTRYATDYGAAFISTSMLILGTAGLAKFHPDWRVIAKANLLGAFWTYSVWYERASLMNQPAAQGYLVYTFLLFQVVSLLRAGRGDALLNLLNTFGCYWIYTRTQPVVEPLGMMEFLIAAIQLGSLWYVDMRYPKRRESELPQSLLILGLIFTGLGIGKYFDAQIQTSVLAGLALALGLISRKGAYQKILQTASYFMLFWSSWSLAGHWSRYDDASLMWNALWLTLSGFILEAGPFRSHHGILRGLVLVYLAMLYLGALLDAVPGEWRTISIVLTGFSLMAAGFRFRRKAYRWVGLGWIFLVGGISIIADMIMLETLYKILLFILLGVGLLGGSYGYVLLEKRMRDQDKAALAEPS